MPVISTRRTCSIRVSRRVRSATSDDNGHRAAERAVAVDSQRRPSIVYRFRTWRAPAISTSTCTASAGTAATWVDKVKIYTAANDCPAALGQTHNGTRVRAYFATTGGGLMVAENTDSWIPQALDPSKAVRRISVVPRIRRRMWSTRAAPTEIDANSGQALLVRRALSRHGLRVQRRFDCRRLRQRRRDGRRALLPARARRRSRLRACRRRESRAARGGSRCGLPPSRCSAPGDSRRGRSPRAARDRCRRA